MPRLKLHFEGWVALPATFLKKLGSTKGDELEAELVGNTIVLRPATGTKASTDPEGPSDEAMMPDADRKQGEVALRPTIKSRGRRKAKDASPA